MKRNIFKDVTPCNPLEANAQQSVSLLSTYGTALYPRKPHSSVDSDVITERMCLLVLRHSVAVL
jgi:hypothetical protein